MARSKTNETKPLKKGRSQFNLVGVPKITDYTYQMDKTYDSGWTENVMTLGVDCGNGNVVYADLRGGYFLDKDSILYVHGYTEDENGKRKEDFDNRFTVDWEDRFDADILNTIADSCFIKIGIEKDTSNKTFTKKFLSAYDAVEYVKAHLQDDMVINVKGNLRYSGIENTYVTKEITSIYLSKATPDKYRATFSQTILLDSNSIRKLDKEKNTFPIDGYVVDYVSKIKVDEQKIDVKSNCLFPVTFEYEGNLNKPEVRTQILNKFFKTKKDKLTEITVEGKLVEGQAIVNITEDDIPDEIKELIELGEYSQEEAEAKCAVGATNREKRMLIVRTEITYVGDGDERKPVIAFDKDKYSETDKVFVSQFIENVDENNTTEDTSTIDDLESDMYDDDDLLKLLEDDE